MAFFWKDLFRKGVEGGEVSYTLLWKIKTFHNLLPKKGEMEPSSLLLQLSISCTYLDCHSLLVVFLPSSSFSSSSSSNFSSSGVEFEAGNNFWRRGRKSSFFSPFGAIKGAVAALFFFF